MPYHPTVDKILALLKEKDCWFETFEHEPVRTSEEAAKTRIGYTLEQGAKAIILKVKTSESEKKFVMLVMPGNLRFDKQKVKTVLDLKDLRFATEEEVTSLTSGVLPGGVPPLGSLFGLRVTADQKLSLNEKIVFNAGDRSFSVAMKFSDYLKIEKPMVADITV